VKIENYKALGYAISVYAGAESNIIPEVPK
jgi:hypothetical protein